ncbi:hypothetical protein PTSG_00560 [Salpingoeca rosetta]|uniref:Uncharacterized protein n=1 Tax=Salpingoeca rosetta (strain ATCC 50818 / BSB-021) TaxID=946362 RepID=F2TWU1_SALR5|nr:uncharacterized protein PTSG_00560 [Salpingoeca rosetta]EGD72537.1 hypothetical protein PTSG_00560 [Salpingoeca rosetta]|eukprot:XP_004999106.1 hypothetical protein PTSG_00560 [Salpingoeca rosetta]
MGRVGKVKIRKQELDATPWEVMRADVLRSQAKAQREKKQHQDQQQQEEEKDVSKRGHGSSSSSKKKSRWEVEERKRRAAHIRETLLEKHAAPSKKSKHKVKGTQLIIADDEEPDPGRMKDNLQMGRARYEISLDQGSADADDALVVRENTVQGLPISHFVSEEELAAKRRAAKNTNKGARKVVRF